MECSISHPSLSSVVSDPEHMCGISGEKLTSGTEAMPKQKGTEERTAGGERVGQGQDSGPCSVVASVICWAFNWCL